jgi:hypothetical protein
VSGGQEPQSPAPKIDAITIEADGAVSLLLGHDPTQPLDYLQERIQVYVSYALDGQMASMYPETNNRPIRIILIVGEEPAGDLAFIVNAVTPRLADYGIELITRVQPN